MELTARDIEQKQFHDAWRGYNQEEVDGFLDKVAAALDAAWRENVALRARVSELDQAVAASRDTEEMLKKTLVTAQQAAEEAIAKAKAKADALVAEAEERARAAGEESRQRVASMEEEVRRRTAEAERSHAARKQELEVSIEKLRSFEAELKQRLKMFLEQQLRGLDTLTERAPAAARPSARPAATTPDRSATGREPTDPVAKPERASRDDPAGEPHAAAQARRGVRGLFQRDEA